METQPNIQLKPRVLNNNHECSVDVVFVVVLEEFCLLQEFWTQPAIITTKLAAFIRGEKKTKLGKGSGGNAIQYAC